MNIPLLIAKSKFHIWPRDRSFMRQVLKRYSTYYRNLDEPAKRVFEYRVEVFLNSIEFKTLGAIRLKSEIEFLIASGFVQITFGRDLYILSHFKRIIITPKEYGYTGFKEKLLGHVDYSRRLITLSWANTKHGFLIADDAHNVVLHEMAHALEFEYRKRIKMVKHLDRRSLPLALLVSRIVEKSYYFLDNDVYEKWLKLGVTQLKDIRAGKQVFLKAYAAKNIHEYFACSIEAFFEQSEQMKEIIPELFDTLVLLLGQDPTLTKDPRINT